MARLADHLERSSELKGSLKSAMIYPIILVIVAIVSIIILLTYVIPQFKELFEGMGAALPLSHCHRVAGRGSAKGLWLDLCSR